MSRFYLTLNQFYFIIFPILDNSLEVRKDSEPGDSQMAIEQMFFFFFYELPIFAIQNFVNMQISFIGLLQVFQDSFGGKSLIILLKIAMHIRLRLEFVVRHLFGCYQIHFFMGSDNQTKLKQILCTDYIGLFILNMKDFYMNCELNIKIVTI